MLPTLKNPHTAMGTDRNTAMGMVINTAMAMDMRKKKINRFFIKNNNVFISFIYPQNLLFVQ